MCVADFDEKVSTKYLQGAKTVVNDMDEVRGINGCNFNKKKVKTIFGEIEPRTFHQNNCIIEFIFWYKSEKRFYMTWWKERIVMIIKVL